MTRFTPHAILAGFVIALALLSCAILSLAGCSGDSSVEANDPPIYRCIQGVMYRSAHDDEQNYWMMVSKNERPVYCVED